MLGFSALHHSVGCKLGTLGGRSVARGSAVADLVDLNDTGADLDLPGEVGVNRSCCVLLSAEQVLAEVGLTAKGSSETDNVARLLFNGLGHGFGGSEATSDSESGFGKVRSDAFGKFDEERFTCDGRLLLVLEARALVSTTGEFDEVDTGSLKLLRHGERLLGVETTISKVSRVDLDGDDELGVRDSLADALDDLEYDAGAAFKVASVLIGTLVDTRRKELREEVSVSSVKLNTVALSLVEHLGSETKATSNVVDLVNGQRTGLAEGHAHTRRALNIRRRHRCRSDFFGCLTTGVGNLSDDERTMRLGSVNDRLVRLDVLIMRSDLGVNAGVLLGFRISSIARDVSKDDGANLALTPDLVQVDVLGGGPATLLEVVVGPSAETLSHGALERRVGRRNAVGEGDGPLENFEVRHRDSCLYVWVYGVMVWWNGGR